jgi:hypothetical protein
MEEEIKEPVYRFSKNFEKLPPKKISPTKRFDDIAKYKKEHEGQEPPVENPSLLPTVLGGGAGAYAVHSGANKRFFSPAPDVYAPSAAPNMPTDLQGGLPSAGPSNVQNVMLSERDKGPSGWQRQSGQNWEAQRQALEVNNRELPKDLSHPFLQSGPMYPTEGGIAIPKSLAIELEEGKGAKAAAEKASHDLKMQQEAYKRAAQERLSGKAAGIGKVGTGALGAAMSTASLYDAIKDMSDKGFSVRNILQVLSGAGGLAMTVAPTIPTTVIGTAMQIPEMAYQSSRIEDPERDPRSGLDL